ncbi:cytochrome P450, partial [Streptomyces sp. NPDC002920]
MASVPLAPKPLPLAGHTLSLLRTPLAFLNSLPETGDLVEVRFGTVQVYFACTPELARQVIMDERTFDKGGPFYKRTREIFGNGLGTCPHAEHRRQRRLIQPAFTSARYGHYAKVMTERIGEVVGGWREGQSLDLFPEMQRITAFTVMTTMIGPQALGPDIMPRVIEDMNTVVKGMYFRMFLPSALDRVPLPSNRRHERAMARLRSDLGAAIARYRSVEDDQQDLMSILVRAQDEESAEDGRTRLTEEELVSQVETIFVAGADSTAGIIAWALHLIASRPGIEAALQQEADEVLVDGAAGF